jgi:hypothetical protein
MNPNESEFHLTLWGNQRRRLASYHVLTGITSVTPRLFCASFGVFRVI